MNLRLSSSWLIVLCVLFFTACSEPEKQNGIENKVSGDVTEKLAEQQVNNLAEEKAEVLADHFADDLADILDNTLEDQGAEAMKSIGHPIEVKVVVVTMFEIGELTGDKAGEFQHWKERRNLNQKFSFLGYKDLYYNAESGILGIVTGIGTARSAAAIMALGMDPRFDLSKSYWLIAGIAGFDPADASIGSASWSEYQIDGDLAHQIDAREMPADWEFGYFARYTTKPFDPKKPEPTGEMYQLNTGLTNWAYALTRDMDLGDDKSLVEVRERYTEHEMARKPPFVLKGANMSSYTFWHGAILTDWANKWTSYWTQGKGNFVSSGMEDTGTYLSISWLDKIDRADKERVMVLRTASNYTMQPPGLTAAENLLNENKGYAGLKVAVESAYMVGSKVVDELLTNWKVYRDTIPQAKPAP